MRILAIDPGVSNGVAVCVNGEYVTTIIKDPTQFFPFFEEGLDRVVIETFQASVISKYGLHTVRIVGGIEMLCGYLNIPITRQNPQVRVAFYDFARRMVHAFGPFATVGDTHNHQADGLAHLLAFQHNQGLIKMNKNALYTTDTNELIVSL